MQILIRFEHKDRYILIKDEVLRTIILDGYKDLEDLGNKIWRASEDEAPEVYSEDDFDLDFVADESCYMEDDEERAELVKNLDGWAHGRCEINGFSLESEE